MKNTTILIATPILCFLSSVNAGLRDFVREGERLNQQAKMRGLLDLVIVVIVILIIVFVFSKIARRRQRDPHTSPDDESICEQASLDASPALDEPPAVDQLRDPQSAHRASAAADDNARAETGIATCPYCGTGVLYLNEYCPSCQRSRLDGSTQPGSPTRTLHASGVSERPKDPRQYSRLFGPAALALAWSMAFNLNAAPSLPEEFSWGMTAGGVWEDDASRVAADSAGNAYILGDFTGDATFGLQTIRAVGMTNEWGDPPSNFFLAKVSPQGESRWVSPIEAEGVAEGLAVTPAGEAYVAARFSGVARLGTQTFESEGTDSDQEDGFPAPFAADGLHDRLNWRSF